MKRITAALAAALLLASISTFGIALTAARATPVISGSKVAVGAYHSCAVTNAGGVKCWGVNNSYQLGVTHPDGFDGHDGSTSVPQTVVFPAGTVVVGLAANAYATCALTDKGAVWCWGGAFDGSSLGDNTQAGGPTPVQPIGLDGTTKVVTEIVGNARDFCVLLTDQSVSCWGKNDYGDLGTGDRTVRWQPTPVLAAAGVPLTGVIGIAAGQNQTCATLNGPILKCWGQGDTGQMGNGSSDTYNLYPVTVVTTNTGALTKATAGLNFACGLTEVGLAACWGGNNFGQLANGSVGGWNPNPAKVSGTTAFSALTAGVFHACGLTQAGTVYCWGQSGYVGTAGADKSVPTAVAGLSDVTGIASGFSHTCAITTTGAVWCWGSNWNLQLGNAALSGSNSVVPVLVDGSDAWGKIKAPRPTPAAGDTVASFSWPRVEGATKYTVSGRAEGASEDSTLCEVSAPATQCTVAKLVNGTKYTLRLNVDLANYLPSDAVSVRPIAENPTQGAGQKDGEPITIIVAPNQAKTGLETSQNGGSWSVTFGGLDPSGKPRNLDAGGTLRMLSTDKVTVSGNGFAPGSVVDLYLHSTPTYLGQATVDKDGGFASQLALPALPAGSHLIQANGQLSDSLANLSVSVPMELAAPQRTDTSNTVTSPPSSVPTPLVVTSPLGAETGSAVDESTLALGLMALNTGLALSWYATRKRRTLN